jgi:hypothetical protein
MCFRSLLETSVICCCVGHCRLSDVVLCLIHTTSEKLTPLPSSCDCHLLLRDFGPQEIIFMKVCVVITVAIVMLLRDFGPYGIIFMTMCLLL